jgi:hypothetical protein
MRARPRSIRLEARRNRRLADRKRIAPGVIFRKSASGFLKSNDAKIENFGGCGRRPDASFVQLQLALDAFYATDTRREFGAPT